MKQSIENKIRFQIENVMLSENIDEKKSIQYLMDYYSNNGCTAFNVDSIINVLKDFYKKVNGEDYKN